MPFANYQSVADVARPFRIHFRREPCVSPQPVPLSDSFRAEIDFTLREVPFDSSEAAVCETLIYPFLREVWRVYLETLTLWSHQPLVYDADLSGVPDYLVARRSPLGALIFDQPCLLVVEAKRDDFSRGWGQCLAAMLAAQKLNAVPEQTVYGITTNGQIWQFGHLYADVFTQDPRAFTLEDIDGLGAVLHFVFAQCCAQVARLFSAV
ncbi:MAG: hypothetical protein FJZ47_11785 [Candidatus Tectomicrobia bacterium]|uniref:Uncharacterized protein n=1 Tax=Tectimicrobiota bacterium TaxID=2528274 RepID=A0A937W0E5_UNCTE|nr:hypothetical protein [Candidatus Tectomicrobia bacterium]